MIYTSYFSRVSMVKNPIAICGGIPDWYTGKWFKGLAPKWSFFDAYKKGKIDENGYTEEYKKQVLADLDQFEIRDYLMSMYPGEEDITLLCYETPDEFCHRHLVSDWFKEVEIDVKEFEPPQGNDSLFNILGDIG